MKALIGVVACMVFSVSCTKESKKSEPAQQAPATAQAARVSAGQPAEAQPAVEGGESCAGNKETGSCCGGWDKVAAEQPAIPANAEWTTLKVSGMTCGGCARRIQATLAGIEGILGVEADHQTGQVKVAAAPGTQDVRGKVAPRINALGYQVSDI